MRVLRRRLGVFVLALLGAHAGTVTAAAIVLASDAGPARAASADDCCPAGSHADGMCPMRTTTSHNRRDLNEAECRMVCANQDSGVLVLLNVSTEPPRQHVVVPRPSEAVEVVSSERLLLQSIAPPSPPPRG